MRKTWVQDIKEVDAENLISKIDKNNHPRPKGSKYIIGDSKSGKLGKVGIYFKDPTE